MGQKIHPISHRLGIIETWRSKWFASRRNYRFFLKDDVRVRAFLRKKLSQARVDQIGIERSGKTNELVVNIHTAKPGMVIGRGGAGIEELKKEVEKTIFNNQTKVRINIHEIRQGALSASVVGQNIASDIERRIPFRRAAKQGLGQIQKAGGKGGKIRIAGRLNGAEIARVELFNWGSIPLHTLRADIDYAQIEAHTTYGVIGVSVWIYKGEVLDPEDKERPSGSDDVLKEIQKITRKKDTKE